MNLYSKKNRTKIGLFVLAALIIGVSLFYSSRIVNKIRNEEREKVKLWSDAIQSKAELVSYTQKLFDMLREEEQKKVNHWYEATKILTQSTDIEQQTSKMLIDIITDNTTIPIIVVDDIGRVVTKTNINKDGSPPSDSLVTAELRKMKAAQPPLTIRITPTKRQYLYYRESHIFRELQEVLDNLINNFISETVLNAASVPVIYADSAITQVIATGNVDSSVVADSTKLMALIEEMRAENPPIAVNIDNQGTHYIFYKDSFLLTQLQYYPYIQLIAIAIFLLISYLLFSTFRNAEQNQVWVGMAKETAHQLGTPLSSLLAWKDLLEAKGVDPKLLGEMGNDIKRLEVITARFSKIGAAPELHNENVHALVTRSIGYLAPRLPRQVAFEINPELAKDLEAKINVHLFEWVLENLIKNAVDAMAGKGNITVNAFRKSDEVIIDISDTGKGIPSNKHKTVFEPGFTTRKRGWGLGLTLVKRIVEEYHSGRIFVKHSEPGQGTTFRIILAVGN